MLRLRWVPVYNLYLSSRPDSLVQRPVSEGGGYPSGTRWVNLWRGGGGGGDTDFSDTDGRDRG